VNGDCTLNYFIEKDGWAVMGCRNEWADDSHIVMEIYIEAPWTWEEFMSQAQQTFAVIKAHGKPCATTVDVSRIGAMPKGNVLRHLSEIESQMPENVFASVVIGAPYMVSVFMDIIIRMRPRAQRIALFAKTREEAHEKIQERYATIKASAEKGS
jgi:C4-dicarboxylate-specific signal transduction histidine kinase